MRNRVGYCPACSLLETVWKSCLLVRMLGLMFPLLAHVPLEALPVPQTFFKKTKRKKKELATQR